MQIPMTPGVIRSLERAANLAIESGNSLVEPVCLLWAIILDESRAAEILANFGLTKSTLTDYCDQPANSSFPEIATLGQIANSSVSAKSQSEKSQKQPKHGPLLDEILLEAQRYAARSPGDIEMTSEHLLWGMAAVNSPVAEVLRTHGIDSATLSSSQKSEDVQTANPLAVDFEIEWEQPLIKESPNQKIPEPEIRVVSGANDRDTLLRLLDAAANRAREGLRVLEDYTRFQLNDIQLTGELKDARHQVSHAFGVIDGMSMLAARDTAGDVGTTLTNSTEATRTGTRDVLIANFKRVQEALRTLEEFGKCLDSNLGSQFKTIRYRLYSLEKSLLIESTVRQRIQNSRLYLLVTSENCRQPVERVIKEALQSGVDVIQVREKTMGDHDLLTLLHQVRNWTREANSTFIVNDRPDLAVLCDADGVHIGQEELSVSEARRIVGEKILVGVSTHDITQVKKAVADSADYLGVGPVFPSLTKKFNEFPGLEFVKQVAAEPLAESIPWFAIGGINSKTVSQVISAGASQIAVSSEICQSDSPSSVTRKLRRAVPEK